MELESTADVDVGRSTTVADDRTKIEAEDSSRDGASGHDEVERFARYYDISVEQARHLIAKFGSNKQVLNREAWKLRH